MSTPFWDVSLLDNRLAQADQFDNEGFLRQPSDWNEALAHGIAHCLGLTLSDDHFRVLLACRAFYAQYQRMPTTRAFVKYLGQQLGEPWGMSMTLMQHFPDTPMRFVALCAGLPKPPNCF
ncbi:MAG: TusE/DsrC/DsvC family sulfur relay protein [Moraxellaceae bacterium]|nr:TusE/DsrC/DsvC family sulfur relay protein [Moraxellaceae bacterium]MDP1775870.1 TusE/DsrC/DsvC family sulfur relay protein [Moraxellaceae bacterium]